MKPFNFNDVTKSLIKDFRQYQKQMIAAGMALILGAGCVGLSFLYRPAPQETMVAETTEQTEETPAETLPESTEETQPENSWIFTPSELNLAHIFPEGADQTDPAKSLAGEIFYELMTRDANWSSGIYSYSDVKPADMADKLGISKSRILGKYNPEDTSHKCEEPSTWTIGNFRNVRIYAVDGDGHSISPYSNVEQIMAMANVYTYYHDPTDREAFLAYAKTLWEASHSYTMSISDIYYCSGCVGKHAKELEQQELLKEAEEEKENPNAELAYAESAQSAETAESEVSPSQESSAASVITAGLAGTENKTEEELASPSDAKFSETLSDTDTETTAKTAQKNLLNASEAENESTVIQESQAQKEDIKPIGTPSDEEEDLSCPGHVDLTITLKISGFSENNSLFSLDAIGNERSPDGESGWQGWTEENRQTAITLASKDWYQNYGLSISSISTGTPLTASEIEEYLDALPSDISETRKELLRFALNSVGKVPYYWGGKPSAPNYDGNHFGVMTSPDVDGRTLKGLDCSGWISWVYWSVTGERLAYEGTSGLAALGKRVNREDLKPGDILIRTGEDSHVIMFLGWTSDGRILCINETSGSVNNVTISVRDAGWPYCRSLID